MIHAHTDVVAIARGDVVHCLGHMVWNGAGDGVEVTKLLEMRGARETVAVEVAGGSCGVGWAGFEGLMSLSEFEVIIGSDDPTWDGSEMYLAIYR